MRALTDTMWVSDEAQLRATVETLVEQGGRVLQTGEGRVQVLVPKRLSVPVLIGGLVLFVVPGVVYLVWWMTDRDRTVTVQVGQPPNLHREPPRLWADDPQVAPMPPPEREPTVFGTRPPGGHVPDEPMPYRPPEPGAPPAEDRPQPPAE